MMFTYSHHATGPVQRTVIRSFERVLGKRRLRRIDSEREQSLATAQDPFEAAVSLLRLRTLVRRGSLANISATGRLVLIANHPFGVIDGILACHLMGQVRSDFRILANSALESASEIRPWLLPVDFRGTRESLETNLRSRAAAQQHVRGGGALVVFPAGAVSTAPQAFGRAVDAKWSTFVAKLIHKTSSSVLPVYFHGQNSWMFQAASQVSVTLRLSLLLRESLKHYGREVEVSIGDAVPYDDLAGIRCRQELTDHLRNITHQLA